MSTLSESSVNQLTNDLFQIRFEDDPQSGSENEENDDSDYYSEEDEVEKEEVTVKKDEMEKKEEVTVKKEEVEKKEVTVKKDEVEKKEVTEKKKECIFCETPFTAYYIILSCGHKCDISCLRSFLSKSIHCKLCEKDTNLVSLDNDQNFPEPKTGEKITYFKKKEDQSGISFEFKPTFEY